MKVNERKQKKDKLNRSKTRKSKADDQTEYNKTQKEVRECVRKDKRAYIENLASQAEEAATRET